MAEVKNAFIKSKMNRDLDARLLPNGEYREGINIQVSRSEGADVGALENVLGNEQLVDFRLTSGCNCLLNTINVILEKFGLFTLPAKITFLQLFSFRILKIFPI